jgi:hypothetical protein
VGVAALLASGFVAIAAVPQILFGSGAEPPAALSPAPVAEQPPAAQGRCGLPAQVLDLTNWKVTLPVASPDNAKAPQEITQPTLAGFNQAPWFRVSPTCDAVLFRAPVNGTTTSGSKYPRSELREMTDNGSEVAGWSATAGTHWLTVTEAFVRLPSGKPELVGAQIHDADDDISVFRLEGTRLWITDGDNPHSKLITDHYALGTRFDAGFEVSDGQVRAFYNGALQTTLKHRFRGAYFKAGAYTQANCTNSAPCSADNYGETMIYALSVFHQVTTGQLVWDWIVAWAPLGLGVVILLIFAGFLARRQRARRA